jgi:DNA-binding PadR family transcriptional regulator
MRGKRRDGWPVQEYSGHRRHHEPEQGPPERGRHHGGHYGRGGNHGHGRHGLHSGRKLSSSDLQLILMALLANRPAHGYELIKSLEDHSHGLYIPSPGMIYPALTYLEEIGFAAVVMEGTKKRYSLTDAGRDHYEQNRDVAARILSDMERIGAEMAQARAAMESGSEGCDTTSDALGAARHELRRSLFKEGPYTAEEAQRVAEILNRAAGEIRQALAASEDLSE